MQVLNGEDKKLSLYTSKSRWLHGAERETSAKQRQNTADRHEKAFQQVSKLQQPVFRFLQFSVSPGRKGQSTKSTAPNLDSPTYAHWGLAVQLTSLAL